MVRVDETSFGSITVNGKRYPHDIWVFADGSIKRRDRDHEFVRAELELLLKGEPEVVVVGTGQSGCVEIDREATRIAAERGIEIIGDITPRALEKYNEAIKAGRKAAAAFHVTC